MSWPVYVSRYLSVHVNKGIALETTGNGFVEINHEMTYGTHYVDVCLACWSRWSRAICKCLK